MWYIRRGGGLLGLGVALVLVRGPSCVKDDVQGWNILVLEG